MFVFFLGVQFGDEKECCKHFNEQKEILKVIYEHNQRISYYLLIKAWKAM